MEVISSYPLTKDPFLPPIEDMSIFPSSLSPLTERITKLVQERDLKKAPPVIGIGGCPGVGKTHFTDLLERQLKQMGLNPLIIHFDDWANPPEKETEDYFDFADVHRFFTDFNQNRSPLQKPVINELNERSQETIDLAGKDILIFEGLFALNTNEDINYGQYCDLGIFISAENKLIYNWKRNRDLERKKPLTESEFRCHMGQMFSCLKETILPHKKKDALTVNKDANHEYSLSDQY